MITKQKDMMFSGKLIKSGEQLIYVNNTQDNQYKDFKKSLEEGQIVEIFMDANSNSGTLAQIAKIKVCIRKIAVETGNTFAHVEEYVKKKSGFCIESKTDDGIHVHYKSSADGSSEDLGLMIQTIIEMGDFLNINFR